MNVDDNNSFKIIVGLSISCMIYTASKLEKMFKELAQSHRMRYKNCKSILLHLCPKTAQFPGCCISAVTLCTCV